MKEVFSESGFAFATKAEAETAKKEAEGIKYIKSKVDYGDPVKAYKIYCRLIEDNIFSTPVGIAFLKDFRDYLETLPSIPSDKLPDIPVKRQVVVRDESKRPDNKAIELKKKEEKKADRKAYSLILNIVLGIMVIAMFVLVKTSDSPTILNYRNEIINEYEEWNNSLQDKEDKLNEREKQLDEREKKLNNK